MAEIQYNLWERINQDTPESFKADVKEGKVPELPFYIIDQDTAKTKIKEKIDNIGQNRFQTSIITANYGNGKTNILKYLKLFYTKLDSNIHVLYYRADVDNYDIIINLLKIIEDHYTENILSGIKTLIEEDFDYSKLVNGFNDNFSSIKEYTDKLFTSEESETKNIFYLGTGRLNSKRYFDKYNIRQLKDYDRREILVLFLNILSKLGIDIIFCIDEIEKIREKSKTRFSYFLTSLRELIDLSNKINSHYLILAITDATDSNLIQLTNEALYSRIHQHIIPIHPISVKKDKIELINYLKDLFGSEKDTEVIYKKLSKKTDATSNRLLIQSISDIIFNKEDKLTISAALKKENLLDLFNETKNDLEINVEAFKNIHRKFFDPLEYYLESFNIKIEDFSSQLRYYYNYETETLCYFIFNEDLSLFENEVSKIKNTIEYFNLDKKIFFKNISIFVPAKMELNYSYINKYEDLKDYKINIIDIVNYEELFTLLELYRSNFELQPKLQPIIENYTDSSL